MKTLKTILAAAVILAASFAANAQPYTPSEGNLQARKDFVNERFGIFLHWGIYASYGQGEWYLNNGKLNITDSKFTGSFNGNIEQFGGFVGDNKTSR